LYPPKDQRDFQLLICFLVQNARLPEKMFAN